MFLLWPAFLLKRRLANPLMLRVVGLFKAGYVGVNLRANCWKN